MKKQFLLAAGLVLSNYALAQYNFSTFTAPYQGLASSTELAAGMGWDDPVFTVNLEFPFTIGGQTYTQMSQEGVGAEFYFSTNGNVVQIVGYWSDLADAQEIGATPSIISYAVEGLPSNRICKIQYDNCSFYNEVNGDEPNANSRVNFQIWFYENNSIIEFRFGENNISDQSEVHDFGLGPLIAFVLGGINDDGSFESAFGLTGNPMSPLITSLTFDDEPEALAGNPESGRVYRFEPTTVGVEETRKAGFNLFPSLAHDFIRVNGLEAFAQTYRITDITGKVIKSGIANDGEQIDVSALTAGLYIFQIETSDKVQKFVKQ